MPDLLGALVGLMRERQKAGRGPYVLVLGDEAAHAANSPPWPERIRLIMGYLDKDTDWQALPLDEVRLRFADFLSQHSENERAAVLSESHADPSPGHRALAWLVHKGLFDLILTTCVDNLLETALQDEGLREGTHYVRLVRGSHADADIVARLDQDHPRVKILKLHGDLSAYQTALTFQEFFQFDKVLETKLRQLLGYDVIVVGHDTPFYDDINRSFPGEGGTLYYVHPTLPNARLAPTLFAVLRARNAIHIGLRQGTFDVFFTELTNQFDQAPAPLRPAPKLRIHEACAVWSILFYLPRFTADALRPVFRTLALPVEQRDKDDYRKYHRHYGTKFIRGYGRIFDDTLTVQAKKRLPWLTRQLIGGESLLPFYPFLVKSGWRLHLSGPPEYVRQFRVETRLRFHLYPTGVCNVLLIAPIRALGDGSHEGTDVHTLIHLLKHLSPGDQRKEARFTLCRPERIEGATSDELIRHAMQRLAKELYADTPPDPIAGQRQSRVLYLYNTAPRLDSAEHARHMHGLLKLHSRWDEVTEEQASPYVTRDFGWYEGDWNIIDGAQAVLYTPERPSNRHRRRILLWKVIAAAELALAQDLLMAYLPGELKSYMERGDDARWERSRAIAEDLILFAPDSIHSYQRKVYYQVAAEIHLEEARQRFERQVDRLERRWEQARR